MVRQGRRFVEIFAVRMIRISACSMLFVAHLLMSVGKNAAMRLIHCILLSRISIQRLALIPITSSAAFMVSMHRTGCAAILVKLLLMGFAVHLVALLAMESAVLVRVQHRECASILSQMRSVRLKGIFQVHVDLI